MKMQIKVSDNAQIIEGFKALEKSFALTGTRVALRESAKPIKKEFEIKSPYDPRPKYNYPQKKIKIIKAKNKTFKVGGAKNSNRTPRNLHLKNSFKIKQEKVGNHIIIKIIPVNAYWAKFIEFGTSKKAARPIYRTIVKKMQLETVEKFTREMKVQLNEQLKKQITKTGKIRKKLEAFSK
jgi:HK97 gp10 family phage protein